MAVAATRICRPPEKHALLQHGISLPLVLYKGWSCHFVSELKMGNMKYLSSLLTLLQLPGAAVGTNSGRSLPSCCWEEKAEQ